MSVTCRRQRTPAGAMVRSPLSVFGHGEPPTPTGLYGIAHYHRVSRNRIGASVRAGPSCEVTCCGPHYYYLGSCPVWPEVDENNRYSSKNILSHFMAAANVARGKAGTAITSTRTYTRSIRWRSGLLAYHADGGYSRGGSIESSASQEYDYATGQYFSSYESASYGEHGYTHTKFKIFVVGEEGRPIKVTIESAPYIDWRMFPKGDPRRYVRWRYRRWWDRDDWSPYLTTTVIGAGANNQVQASGYLDTAEVQGTTYGSRWAFRRSYGRGPWNDLQSAARVAQWRWNGRYGSYGRSHWLEINEEKVRRHYGIIFSLGSRAWHRSGTYYKVELEYVD